MAAFEEFVVRNHRLDGLGARVGQKRLFAQGHRVLTHCQTDRLQTKLFAFSGLRIILPEMRRGSVQPSGPTLTHQAEDGRPRMVDVGGKSETARMAVAEGVLRVSPEALAALREGRTPKGDPLLVAQIAGIQAAKRTADLIPLCHPLPLTQVDVHVEVDDSVPGVRARASAHVQGRTGVEMEALTAVSVALLTAYDMLKGLDRRMSIESVHVSRKEGGRSGSWEEESAATGVQESAR